MCYRYRNPCTSPKDTEVNLDQAEVTAILLVSHKVSKQSAGAFEKIKLNLHERRSCLILERMKLGATVLVLFLCLCLGVENSAAQCPDAAILPSDVAPSIADKFFTSQLTKQIEELQQKVTKLLQAYHVDAYSIAVVYRNSTIYSAGLVDTPFRIGSITKVFAAMGPLLLRKQGVLSLDDPVKKFLPGFSVINPYGEHDITLRELMGHTSGLPRDLCAGLYCEYPDLSEKENLVLIAKMQLARPPWSFLPHYSNLGFAILGHAWEKATSPRKTWSEFLRDELLAPLEMRDTGVPADLQVDVELAPGDVHPYPANYSLGWQAAAGDMYSTTPDLAKFLKFLLHPNPTLLSAAAIREMTHPTTVFTDTIPVTGFALPWELIGITPTGTNRSTTLITKNGGLGTYRSMIAFHPASQLGIAVLTSVNNTPATDVYAVLATNIMKDLIPAVQSLHSTFISSLYSGVYMCNHTAPVVSAHIPNTTLQVLGGSIRVTSSTTLANNLAVHLNMSVVLNGAHESHSGSRFLVQKPGRNPHAFWSSPGSCWAMASLAGADPEIARPNFPESVSFYEFQFEPERKLLQWPAFGATCSKA